MFSAELSSKIKEVENRLKKLESLSKLQAEFDELAEEFSNEIKAVNKEITPLFDNDVASDKKIIGVEKTMKVLISNVSKLQAGLVAMDRKAASMERAWSVPALKRIVDGMAMLSKTQMLLEKRSAELNRKLERTNAGMVAIAKHASDIEEQRQDAKYASEELAKRASNLKDTMDHFFKQIDAVDSKLNANANALSDLTGIIETLKARLDTVESQNPIISQMSTQSDQQSQTIDQLNKRLAYLEKTTVKTIVLD